MPVLKQVLIYAPLLRVAALVDRRAVKQIREGLLFTNGAWAGSVGEIIDALRSRSGQPPLPRRGPLEPPFLGLLPTRGCNLACAYCGFLPEDGVREVMDLELARDAVTWYLDLAAGAGARATEVHFFGGEPFCAPEVVEFAVHAARLKAAQAGCTVRFQVATNGTFDEARCRWAANNLDDIVLSLDGPADIHDRQRPARGGQGSFEAVVRSAQILSEGPAELSFRACVTAETIDRLADIATWLCREFRPVSVCFEPVQPTPQSTAAGLAPPEAVAFARNFIEAARVLEEFGVEPVYATADIRTRRQTFCPVGRDVPIVSPDGTISACYLLREDWEAEGLDLDWGRIAEGTVYLDAEAIEAVRGLNVGNKPFCARCFCKWHCAGGCHVNHQLPAAPGPYGRLCAQTRIIALRNVLKALGQDHLVSLLLDAREALDAVVSQPSDRLADWEGAP